MKTTKLIMGVALIALATFTSCKKDYTCTCTTVVGPLSTNEVHNLSKVTYTDAKKTCKNFEDQANSGLPGGTTCHL
jgi:hypothetical protein